MILFPQCRASHCSTVIFEIRIPSRGRKLRCRNRFPAHGRTCIVCFISASDSIEIEDIVRQTKTDDIKSSRKRSRKGVLD